MDYEDKSGFTRETWGNMKKHMELHLGKTLWIFVNHDIEWRFTYRKTGDRMDILYN